MGQAKRRRESDPGYGTGGINRPPMLRNPLRVGFRPRVVAIETRPGKMVRFEITVDRRVYVRAKSGTKRITDPELIALVLEQDTENRLAEERRRAAAIAKINEQSREIGTTEEG